MQPQSEAKFFYCTVGLLLLVPLVAGLTGAFGGPKALASIFGVNEEVLIPPSLANSVRAVCLAFFSWVPLILWSLAAIPERAGVFRIIVGCAFLTGFARLTGWLADGYPGAIPAALMVLELGGMPLLLAWHTRMVRIVAGVHAQPGAPADAARAARSRRG